MKFSTIQSITLLFCAVLESRAFSVRHSLAYPRPFVLASSDHDISDGVGSDENIEPVSPPAPVSNPTPIVRRMDPLVASLTRTDNGPAVNKNTPTINLPLKGEVQLDQTLFVLAPVVLFAVLGGLLSIYVALNSGDAVSQAWNAYETAISTPAGTKIVDPDACRGICSSQQEDLQGLAAFMNNLAGKK